MTVYGGHHNKCQSAVCIKLRKEVIKRSTMSLIYKYRVYCVPCETFQRRDPRVDSEGIAQYCKCCGKRCRLGAKQGSTGKIKYRQRRFKVLIEQTVLDISSDDSVTWIVDKPLTSIQVVTVI